MKKVSVFIYLFFDLLRQKGAREEQWAGRGRRSARRSNILIGGKRDSWTLLPCLLPTSLTLDTNKAEPLFLSLFSLLALPSEEHRSFVPRNK